MDYSQHWHRVAYLMVYAPRHAVYWREHFRNNGYAARGDIEWNSVGTGPASEIIGALSGLDWPQVQDEDLNSLAMKCRVVALDEEVRWRSIQGTVETRFQAETGRTLELTQTNDAANLKPMTLTLGSYVLSDAARSNDVAGLLSSVRDSAKPALGMFLDTVSFKRNGDDLYVSKEIPVEFDRWFEQVGLGLKDAVNAELDGCPIHELKKPLEDDPALNCFNIRFK